MNKTYTPITEKLDWNYNILQEYYEHVERIGIEKFKLNIYPNQIEIISYEQMLEAYSTHAMPLYYEHWSSGMTFIEELSNYKYGGGSLAYEVVINSTPCISYLMEGNTTIEQILVLAHAAMGHNHFFKNNYLFKQWTSADSIIDYLAFVKKYISDCEEQYGSDEVEEILDACHALGIYSINKYKRPSKLTAEKEEQEKIAREKWIQYQLNDIWRTIPITKEETIKNNDDFFPLSSEENILYFIEKNAPNLSTWKKEIIRIVRKLQQYFYPQMQTKILNEGFATFMHYHIVNELYNEGLINENFFFDFIILHNKTINQLPFDSPFYSGFNVYALGFAMLMDIKRISMDPTEEDREWFKTKEWVGNQKWLDNILYIVQNYRDESFILEFLSPKIIREFKMFCILDDSEDSKYEITAIHNDEGYKHVREVLAKEQDLFERIPEIQVAKGGVDIWDDRSLTLEHIIRDGRPLDKTTALETLNHLNVLWGYDVKIKSISNKETLAIYEYKTKSKKTLLDIFETSE